jgi:hypothetical protein
MGQPPNSALDRTTCWLRYAALRSARLAAQRER